MEIFLSLSLVVMGLGCAGLGLWRFTMRYEAIRQQKLAIVATADSSKASIAQARNQIQTLDERIAALAAESAALEAKTGQYEKILSLPERELRPAIFIATDSMVDGRTPFRTTLHCTGPTPAWAGTRDYVLWARDIDRARMMFTQRFDPKAGFVMGPVATHIDPL